jgi:hypothetical protein
MEPHSEILQELQSLNSPLAYAPRTLLLTLPTGYFHDSAAVFVAGALAQDAPDIIPTFAPSELPAGEVPMGYFEDSAALFVSGVLAQEAEDLPLSFAPSKDVFGEVPAGYFESAAATFVGGAMAADAPERSLNLPLSKEVTGEVPAGFFEQFPAEMLQLAKATVFVENLPRPVLAAPPADYFENLPAQVMRRIQAEQRANTLPAGTSRKTIALPVFRWVAAAALVVGISFGLYQANRPDAGSNAISRALATVPQSELQAYVTQNIDDFETELLEKGADVSHMPVKAPHLQPQDIELYLQEEGLL